MLLVVARRVVRWRRQQPVAAASLVAGEIGVPGPFLVWVVVDATDTASSGIFSNNSVVIHGFVLNVWLSVMIDSQNNLL